MATKARSKRRDASSAFDAVIPDLYDALLQPGAWTTVLSRLADAAGVAGVHFVTSAPDDQRVFSEMSATIAPEFNAAYRDHYGGIDPRRHLVEDMPFGTFLLCHRHCDNDFVRHSEFYNDFCIPSGIRYMAASNMLREDGYDSVIGFLGKVGGEPFGGRDVRRFRPLLPHLRRVAQVQKRLAELEQGLASLAGAVDRLQSGLAIVDGDGRLRHCNRAAEAFLRASDGLTIRSNRLQTTDDAATRTLERLIDEAAQCAAGGDPHKGGGQIAVPRGNGKRPLLLLVTPLPEFSASRLWRQQPAVAVYISNPDAPPAPADRLAALFRLTPAEARLAVRLAAGDRLDQAAEAFGLSKYTLRAQLRALMDKTGTSRQAELVRLLTSVLALREGAG